MCQRLLRRNILLYTQGSDLGGPLIDLIRDPSPLEIDTKEESSKASTGNKNLRRVVGHQWREVAALEAGCGE